MSTAGALGMDSVELSLLLLLLLLSLSLSLSLLLFISALDPPAWSCSSSSVFFRFSLRDARSLVRLLWGSVALGGARSNACFGRSDGLGWLGCVACTI
ncbi:hypothetical protein C7974DRAFT_15852 [Boeremia exigua]|uniref:uncharacterized protein n=1 Tax=Boeremia exigua TaxID=749465 RepID=UPI001E8D0FDC|nr:uncharacterized protein C7974DRAFT_15852 [Boeremia exigua]KAH6644164.1 hypothetical protein C7974DRAFT_15852 [Boeremia exigua]